MRVAGPLLSFFTLQVSQAAPSVQASGGGACTDALSCSLAGNCTAAGVCSCATWTTGPHCEALNLRPLPSAASLAAAVQPTGNWTRWGSSVVEENGTFHLFSAEMADECELNVWGWKSTVIHSTSTTGPLGPFTRQGVAIGPEAHNPVRYLGSRLRWGRG
jgi:hypothetical protein